MDETFDFETRFYKALEDVGVRPAPSGKEPVEQDPTEEIEGDKDAEEIEEEKEAAVVRQLKAPTYINLFQHPDAHPIVLDLALLKKYGPEWLEWEPETLEWRIPQDFPTTEVSSMNMEKIMAVKTLHVIDTYWTQWEIFNWCTMPFNFVPPDFDVMQVPTYAQCVVSVDTANRLRDDAKWSEEVKIFIATCAWNDGIFCPIEPADFIEMDTSKLVVDCAEVKEWWPSVRATGKAPTDETVTAEQLRRALDVHNYLEENRQLLRDQIRLVQHV